MKTCKIEGCEKRHVARGWCNMHYKRWKAHGDPLVLFPNRPAPGCRVPLCEYAGKHYSAGYCNAHYIRLRRRGDVGDPGARWFKDPEEAFVSRVAWDGEHLRWIGAVSEPDGYGRIRVNGTLMLAHRYSYERVHGPIPEGLFMDHRCWERDCVLPEHLRTATPQQNAQNLAGARKGRSLPRGVVRKRNGYQALVGINGRTINAGTFPTIERAEIAVKNCRAFYYGEYAGN